MWGATHVGLGVKWGSQLGKKITCLVLVKTRHRSGNEKGATVKICTSLCSFLLYPMHPTIYEKHYSKTKKIESILPFVNLDTMTNAI